mgnify:CR=1 FL=1
MVVKANNWMELEKVEIKNVTAVRQHPDYKVNATKFPDLALITLDGKLENFNKDTFFLHEVDTLTVGVMSIK